jgi:CheY-like chemotaxis protein
LGFEIREAAGGAEALAMLPNIRPDLVFLDLRMPGIDGLELARRLRAGENGEKLKIIAMSASVLSFNREDAFAAGCDDFLPKPFREDDLLARLGLALHLEWTADSTRSMRVDSNAPFPTTTKLSAAEMNDLLTIAQRGEIMALRQRLELLRGDPLADALLSLAKSYRMERIREVLEERVQSRAL